MTEKEKWPYVKKNLQLQSEKDKEKLEEAALQTKSHKGVKSEPADSAQWVAIWILRAIFEKFLLD